MRAFDSNAKLEIHTSTVHEEKKNFICTKCSTSYAYKETLKSHNFRVHLNIRPYQCAVCEKSFVRKTELTKHVNTNHKVKVNLKKRVK